MNTITLNNPVSEISVNSSSIQSNSYNDFILKNSLELFKEIVVQIKTKSKNGGLSSTEHLIYNLIRGVKTNRGFITPQHEVTDGFLEAKKNLKYLLKFQPHKGYFEKMSAETVADFLAALEA